MVEVQFDIILPTIGRPSLAEAVDSVLAQTHKSFSLSIVVDRGIVGFEESDRILYAAQADPRIMVFQLFRTQQITNFSGADARNQALAVTLNPWIAYIDDDDIWYPNHLETFVEMMQDGSDLLHTRGQAFKIGHKHPRSSKLVKKMLGYCDDPTTVGMAHTRALFNSTSGWKPLDNHDHMLYNEMIANGAKLRLTDKVTYEFRR